MSSPSRTTSAPTILGYFDRLFNGRKLKILGYNRQRIPGNWKLMQENIKDPYHPGLLHTWFVTFGLWRADNKSRMVMDAPPPPRLHDLQPPQRRRAAR
jgi:salicylate 5-hydroxylase large subunit